MKKRKSIRVKIHSTVIPIVLLSLVFIGTLAYINMRRIQDDSSEALTERMKANLTNIVNDKIAFADFQINGYLMDLGNVADYIHRLYKNPENYKEREVDIPRAENKDKLVMQKCLLYDSVTWDMVEKETLLLSNSEDIMNPIITRSKGCITDFNIATESGLNLCYDTQSDIKVGVEYYDSTQTTWYKLAKEKNAPCFTDIYTDSFGRGDMITCTAPFYNEKNEFAGVVMMDILISDLYNRVIKIDLEQATAILVDNAGKIIMPEGKSYPIKENADINVDTANNILSGKKSLDYSGSGYYYAYGPVSNVGWKYCVMISDAVILQPAEAMGEKIRSSQITYIIIFILVIVLVSLLVNIVAKSITSPISSLKDDVDEISGGNLDHQAKVIDNDEIGDLAEKFNSMALSLKDYIKNLTAVTAEKERIGAELNVATQIQADMLPRIFPPFPDRHDMDIYATMQPAKEVGGDFYDFFLIDEDHIALVMADVSGKGVPAALFMVIAKTLIKNRAQMSNDYSPAKILIDVNNTLCEGNEAELFVTVWLGIIDLRTGKGMAANAGHEHPAIRRANGEYELCIYKHSPAVATMEGIRFREHEFEMHHGDTLYVYTDGVAEATNANNELFGNERMLAALNADPSLPPKDILKKVKESIDEFVGEAPQFDDITMLGFTYLGDA